MHSPILASIRSQTKRPIAIAESTLDELHRRTGKNATSLEEDTFLTLVTDPVPTA
jgi:hypothetical protein